MSQPDWEFVANIGDVRPLEHDGFFVYRDKTGVYDPEAEVLVRQGESDDPRYLAYRFILESCTFVNGILSDNKYRPDHPAWFATPEEKKAERPQDSTYLSNICRYCDVEMDELIRLFCSNDPVERARAWKCVADYHGLSQLDDPLPLRRREARKRYKEMNGVEY